MSKETPAIKSVGLIIKTMKSGKKQPEELTGLAKGLMDMSRKGAYRRMRLTARRGRALLKSLKEVIYYLPDCRCGSEDDECHCHDYYYAGIFWLKQTIFAVHPDLSDSGAPPSPLFPKTVPGKLEAIYLREALKIADDLFGDDTVTENAHDWAFNQIYKHYSIFDLCA